MNEDWDLVILVLKPEEFPAKKRAAWVTQKNTVSTTTIYLWTHWLGNITQFLK